MVIARVLTKAELEARHRECVEKLLCFISLRQLDVETCRYAFHPILECKVPVYFLYARQDGIAEEDYNKLD